MRYIKLFAEQCKLSVMSAAIFRANFWLMLIQSIINSFMGVLCIEFIYGSIESIAGWNKREMIVLICTAQIVNQIFRGIIHFNQNRFVSSVGNGSFDRLILKPISIVFQVNTGSIDISSIISASSPLIIIIMQINALGADISVGRVLLFTLFVITGAVILSSFMLMLYALVFLYVKVDGINNIYYLIMDIANKPKEMFNKEFLYGFMFILPAIPIANAPASILLDKGNFNGILITVGIAILFAMLSVIALKAGLKRYTSASS